MCERFKVKCIEAGWAKGIICVWRSINKQHLDLWFDERSFITSAVQFGFGLTKNSKLIRKKIHSKHFTYRAEVAGGGPRMELPASGGLEGKAGAAAGKVDGAYPTQHKDENERIRRS